MGFTISSQRFGRYEAGIVSILAYLTVFRFTDLLTTSVALARHGLYEGNTLILLISNSLGLTLLDAIALTKIAFITGAIFLAVVGIKSTDRRTRKMIFAAVSTFAIIFIFVSLNNLYWIAQST